MPLIAPDLPPQPSYGLSDSTIKLLGGGAVTLALAILTGAWKALGLPVYWFFRHMVRLTYVRDPEMMKALAAALFTDEIKANVQAREDVAQTQREVSALVVSVRTMGEGVSALGPLANNVGRMAERIGEVTEVLSKVVDGQRQHGESIARMDERIEAAWDGITERRMHLGGDARRVDRRKRIPRSTDLP